MNNDDIIRLAIEHTINGLKFNDDGLLRFAKLVAQHERTWVGLTDEEFEYCCTLKKPVAIVEEVEAKLKEKNT